MRFMARWAGWACWRWRVCRVCTRFVNENTLMSRVPSSACKVPRSNESAELFSRRFAAGRDAHRRDGERSVPDAEAQSRAVSGWALDAKPGGNPLWRGGKLAEPGISVSQNGAGKRPRRDRFFAPDAGERPGQFLQAIHAREF